MAQRAFNIAGRLGLDVTGFNKKLGESQKNLNTFRAKINRQTKQLNKDFNKVTRSVKSLAGEIAVLGAATAGFTLLSKKANETAEEISKLASTTASTTREIQALSIAFKENGLEADDVGDVLNTLADRAQDAKDGMQSFIDDFALIGIEVDDLRGKRPAELFEVFADAIANTDEPVKRQAALVRILGDDLGRKLAPELAKGAQHFRDLADEAERAGLIMDDKMIKGAVRANRAMERLETTIGIGVNRVLVEMAPLIETATNKLQNLMIANVDFGKVAISVFTKAGKVVAVFADGIRGLEILFQGLKTIALGVSTVFASVFSTIKQDFTFYDSQVEGLKESLRALGDIMGEPMPSKLFDEFIAKLNEAKENTKDQVGEKQELELFGFGMDEEFFASVDAGAEKLKGTIDGLKTNIANQSKTIEEDFSGAMWELAGTMAEAAGAGKEFFAISQAMAAADAIVKGLQTAGAIRLAYAQMAALSGPAAPGLLAAGEAQAAMATATGFATAGMIAGQTLASFDGGGFTGSGSRSGGVDGRGGFPAILHPNETVVDHTKGQNMSGTVMINFTVHANDSRSFQDSLVQNRGMITSIVQQALANQGRRL